MAKNAYSFDPDYTVEGRHYAHSLISWSSIIAGALAAIAIGLTLNLGGAAIGAATFNPFSFERQEDTLSVAGGLYLLFAQFVALQVGGYVASRSARYPDHFGGLLTGGMVWAVAVFVAVVLGAWAASGAAGSESLTSQAADTVGDVRASVDSADLAEAEAGADAIATFAWWGGRRRC
ncbi:MAG: hypothetical protein WDM79_11735 [Terricaulis sp.]